METKKCSKCKEVKSVSEFNKYKSAKDGLQYKCKLCVKKYHQQHRERINKRKKQYREQNKEQIKQYQKQWRKQNKGYHNNYQKQRRSTDRVFRLRLNIMCSIRNKAIRKTYGQRSKLNDILGLSGEEFKLYFESKFDKGMTWENYGEWEVDHITPISKATTIKEVIELNHYTNLQPLWKHHNMSKGTASYEVEYK